MYISRVSSDSIVATAEYFCSFILKNVNFNRSILLSNNVDVYKKVALGQYERNFGSRNLSTNQTRWPYVKHTCIYIYTHVELNE